MGEKKKLLKHAGNIALAMVVAFLLLKKIPGWIANYRVEGETVKSFQVRNDKGESITLPTPGKKQVVIFWATWCGPCKVELSRFNTAVKEGQLKAEDVIAISLGEDPALVYKEAKARDYSFTTLVDPETASLASLRVDGTPQTYHISENERITHASMGLSLLAVWRAEQFLKN